MKAEVRVSYCKIQDLNLFLVHFQEIGCVCFCSNIWQHCFAGTDRQQSKKERVDSFIAEETTFVRPGVLNPGPRGPLSCNFSSNPNQTHLNQLIKLFRITSKLQEAGEFDQGWSKTLQDSGPPGPGLRTPALD